MKKSKEHLDARQRQIDERLDRSWQPQRTEPVLESGNVRYEVSGRVQGTSCGGLGMIQTVVESCGLQQAIDRNVHLLKRHLPYSESDHVLSQTYNLLIGGVCLENLASLRRNTVFLDAVGARRIPDSTTAGDFLRRFSDEADVMSLMTAINQARSNVCRAQPKDMARSAVIRDSNARCHQENLIEQLKNGVQAMRLPVKEFHGNWAYMVIAALAWNLKAWSGLLLPSALGARAILDMEFRRFLNELMKLSVQILNRSRQLVFRLLEVNQWTELLLEGTDTLKRRCIG